jgi:hypothetical protein
MSEKNFDNAVMRVEGSDIGATEGRREVSLL